MLLVAWAQLVKCPWMGVWLHKRCCFKYIRKWIDCPLWSALFWFLCPSEVWWVVIRKCPLHATFLSLLLSIPCPSCLHRSLPQSVLSFLWWTRLCPWRAGCILPPSPSLVLRNKRKIHLFSFSCINSAHTIKQDEDLCIGCKSKLNEQKRPGFHIRFTNDMGVLFKSGNIHIANVMGTFYLCLWERQQKRAWANGFFMMEKFHSGSKPLAGGSN